MPLNKAFAMLGLAARAGKIASGEFSVEKSIKSFRAHLIILAEDASENTKKKFENMAAFYEIPCSICGDKAALGHAIGRQDRTSVAVMDEGFAAAIGKILKETLSVN